MAMDLYKWISFDYPWLIADRDKQHLESALRGDLSSILGGQTFTYYTTIDGFETVSLNQVVELLKKSCIKDSTSALN